MDDDKSWLHGGTWSIIDDVSLVIAARTSEGAVIVADSRETRHTRHGAIALDRGKKAFRLPSGGIMGIAGPAGIGQMLVPLVGMSPSPLSACEAAYQFARSASIAPFSTLIAMASGDIAILPFKDNTWQRPMPLDREFGTIGLDTVALALLGRCWRADFTLQEAAVLCCASMELSRVFEAVGGAIHIEVASSDDSLAQSIQTTAPSLGKRWADGLASTDWLHVGGAP